jgi:hypothetical protein
MDDSGCTHKVSEENEIARARERQERAPLVTTALLLQCSALIQMVVDIKGMKSVILLFHPSTRTSVVIGVL